MRVKLNVLLTITIVCIHLVCTAQKQFDIRKYGAKGDGIHNDYPALLAATKEINRNGGGELIFSQGVYFLDTYHQPGKPIEDIVFSNCSNLSVKGIGAVIKLQGNFYRSGNATNGKFKYSSTRALIPFYFINCKSVSIKGIEVNGGVSQMKREAAVAETGGHLLMFRDCEGVSILDVNVHHAQSDGIYITGTRSAIFKANNLRSSNNARQGMSIIQLLGGDFERCEFINTGITEGKYGSHAPRAGVDIEPRTGSVSVRNIKFTDCKFENNLGSQFVCSSPKNTENVMLNRCRIVAATGRSAYQLILAARNIVLDNCYIDCGPGNIYPIANSDPGSSVTIKNSTIKSTSAGIISVSKLGKDELVIDNNTIEYTGKTPVKKYFLYLQTDGAVFTNNKIIIPHQFHRKGAPTTLIQKGKIASGNVFYSGNNAAKPIVSYKGTVTVKDK